MANVEKDFAKGKPVYVELDVHKRECVVTVLCQGEDLYHAAIAADPQALIRRLKTFGSSEIHTVYEAGPTGFWLHEALTEAGFDSIVTPPSLVPHVGGRVKTDHRDSKKLASMLAGGFLKKVHVLTAEERADRQLLRTRNQIERHRKQLQNQIKSLLLFHGKRTPATMLERWSEGFVRWIETLPWEHEGLKISMNSLLTLYHQVDEQYKMLTKQIETLALSEKYRERAQLLIQIPGIGIFTAMAIPNYRRFVMQRKKTFLLLAMISWTIIEGCKTPPITITQSQMEAVFAPGRTMRLFWDSTSQPVNVGRSGGPNVYDFSTLPFVMYDSSEMFSVSQIPQLAPRYPSNAVAASEEGGTVYPVFSFSNNRFYREGRGKILSATKEWYQHIIPAAEFLRFPVTFDAKYSIPITVSVETTYVNGIPTETSSDTSSHTTTYIDGYGTLLLPGGLAFECLRFRIVQSFPKTTKSFHFWTREGAVILLDSDTSQPDTGFIKRDYVIYFSPQTRSHNTRD